MDGPSRAQPICCGNRAWPILCCQRDLKNDLKNLEVSGTDEPGREEKEDLMSADEKKSAQCAEGAWFDGGDKETNPRVNFSDRSRRSFEVPVQSSERSDTSTGERASWALQLAGEGWEREANVPRRMDAAAPALTYNPRAQREGSRIKILGSREDPNRIAWGFWGGVLMVALVAYLIFVRGSAGLASMAELLLFSAALVIGMVFFRLGRRSSLREDVLLEIDLEDGHFNWPTASGALLDLKAQEIKEVGCAMVDFPVGKASDTATIRVFSVYLRDRSGMQHDVIEASPDKERGLAVAQLLAKLLQLPVTLLGTGAVD